MAMMLGTIVLGKFNGTYCLRNLKEATRKFEIVGDTTTSLLIVLQKTPLKNKKRNFIY
jgi:hypothetical protein